MLPGHLRLETLRRRLSEVCEEMEVEIPDVPVQAHADAERGDNLAASTEGDGVGVGQAGQPREEENDAPGTKRRRGGGGQGGWEPLRRRVDDLAGRHGSVRVPVRGDGECLLRSLFVAKDPQSQCRLGDILGARDRVARHLQRHAGAFGGGDS